MQFAIEADTGLPPGERRVEIVERKGLGHPDSICDAIAEEFSLALSRFYLDRFGSILHHNVDKVMLAAGTSRARFGGGEIVEPMRIFLAGRATAAHAGVDIPIAEIGERVTREWLGRNLRALDPQAHVRVSSLVRPGSTELVSLYGSTGAASNDTSCGVGYAPLSEVEQTVLAVEQHLGSEAVRAAEPALGEDVKVMAVRREDVIRLTVSCAMIDRALTDMGSYAKAVDRVAGLASEAAEAVTGLRLVVGVNRADDLQLGRLYLTVTGTSGEAGDDGQTGRGNRVNGLITPGRPMTIESVAGKNAVTHVGKLYNLAASLIAERLVASLDDVQGAECRLVSEIGQPIQEPQVVDVRLTGVTAARAASLREETQRVVQAELTRLPRLADELVARRIRLDRWPLWVDGDPGRER